MLVFHDAASASELSAAYIMSYVPVQVDSIGDRNGSEASDSDASTSASDEEADDADAAAAPARQRRASQKAKAAALEILQGESLQ